MPLPLSDYIDMMHLTKTIRNVEDIDYVWQNEGMRGKDFRPFPLIQT